jgi:putative transposase
LPGQIWQIRNEATGECSQRPLTELLELYRTGQLSLIPDQSDICQAAAKLGKELLPQRDQYRISQQTRADRLQKYLEAMDESLSRGTHALQDLIKRVAAEIHDHKPPAPRTLQKARKRWIASDRDFRSQMLGFDRCGNRHRFTPAMEWLIRTSLKYFLSGLRKKITICWHDLNAKVAAINSRSDEKLAKLFTPEERALEFEQVKAEAPLTTPTKWALYRRVNTFSDYDIVAAQCGKDHAERIYRTTFKGQQSPRPLASADIDGTKTDLFSIDEIRHLWLGRTYSNVVFETYCHGCSGFYLGFEPPSVLSYFQALRHSILPKTYIRSDYPIIKNSWDIYGVADTYHLDNAMAGHSKDFKAACKDLQSNILYDLPAVPWFKGLIERWFRELNTQLLHNQPGTTFSRFANLDGDYDPKKNAVIPYGMLRLMFHKFIVDIRRGY